MSKACTEPRWPPRSPQEAFLSSPSGRHKIRQYHDRTSPSPSPLKRPLATPNLRQRNQHIIYQPPLGEDEAEIGEEDEDEDEETLQLRLQTLEARLKLKKLQQKRKKATSTSDVENEGVVRSRPPARAGSILKCRLEGAEKGGRQLVKSASSVDVQVSLSPQKKRIVTAEPRSPGRVLLGIDKGLKGSNVSLRRAPNLRAPSNTDHDPFGVHSDSQSPKPTPSFSSHAGVSNSRPKDRPKSFSERIAESRQHDKEQKDKAATLRKQRSTGFEVQQQELDAFRAVAAKLPESDSLRLRQGLHKEENDFTREEVIKAFHGQTGGLLHRSDTATSVRNTRRHDGTSGSTFKASTAQPRRKLLSPALSAPTTRPARPPSPPSSNPEQSPPSTSSAESTLFEPFSSFHLSKRILPQTFLTRTLSCKTILQIPDLLRTIRAPDFSPPDTEGDYVVFGIIASKSAPRDHKDSHKTAVPSTETKFSITEAVESEQNTRGKYMVLTLTDLTWSLDLYLFTTAFTRFWKLTPGTVITILNPSIMPPLPSKTDTGRFSLVLNSSDDTVLEVGTSRDLGFCKSIKRDGKVCSSWIDRRKTEFCDWHVERQVEKVKRGRMEVNTITAPFAPGGRKSARTGFFGGGSRRGKGEHFKDDGLLREGAQYDRATSSRFFVAPSALGITGRSAANLLDDELDLASRGMGKEERLRRRLAEREKEREIAKKLGEGGNGMGGEYLRIATHEGETKCEDGGGGAKREDLDAGKLGLLGNRAAEVHLSPMKRKAGATGGMEGPRKKTRFVTAKGIREAGRESLGVPGLDNGAREQPGVALTSQDDDDLEIV
ncbi:MAG: hypothetical protein FRX48_00074 [Lasallia pustulata]|uniref:Zinc finger Mcm10/DnaG-type domain-containing protein n=1 Tax=Lasallia pustulata TaxID=136370 RepID=A0A5M8Q2S4_9LECA|nr:MAG: hypothetical protein FRX48_00074 [Lasallia pustulata]